MYLLMKWNVDIVDNDTASHDEINAMSLKLYASFIIPTFICDGSLKRKVCLGELKL